MCAIYIYYMEQKTEDSGSTEYLANAEIDKVLKKVKDDIKHYMAVQGQKEYKYKAQRVVTAAKELDRLNYPKSEICTRLTKTLKGLVSERHVREALDAFPEYKDPVKSAEALGRGDIAATMEKEQILKKPKQQITVDEIKHLNLPKAREVAKYQMAQAEWWKHQLKQELDKLHQLYEMALDPEKSDAEIGKEFREMAKEAAKTLEKGQEKPKPKRGRKKKD